MFSKIIKNLFIFTFLLAIVSSSLGFSIKGLKPELPKVTAAQVGSGYKLPFKSSESWGTDGDYGIHVDKTGLAIDFYTRSSARGDVLAPASGTLSRGCTVGNATWLRLDVGNGDIFRFVHMKASSVPISSGETLYVNQGEIIGQISPAGSFDSGTCSLSSDGPHIHFSWLNSMCNLNIDGYTFDCGGIKACPGIGLYNVSCNRYYLNKSYKSTNQVYFPPACWTAINDSGYNLNSTNNKNLFLQKCLISLNLLDSQFQTSYYGNLTKSAQENARKLSNNPKNIIIENPSPTPNPVDLPFVNTDSLFTSHNNTINQYNQQFPASADMKSSQAKYPNINKFYENGGVAELYQRDPFTGEMLNFGLAGGTINKTIRIGYLPEKDWFSNIRGDFNGDGVTDLFWSSPKNKNSAWYFESNSGTTKVQRFQPDAGITDGWRPLCTGRVDQNSTDDILWINKNTNQMYIWLFDGNGNVNRMVALGNLYQDEKVLACGDFNGDSFVDIYTTTTSQNTNRMISFNSQGNNIGNFSNIQNLPLNGINGGWEAAGVVNNNSNKASVIMRNKTNNDSLKIVSFNSNRTIQSEKILPKPVSTSSYILTTGDYDGDKIDDIVWRNGDNNLNIWYLNNGGEFASQKVAGTGHYTRLF